MDTAFWLIRHALVSENERARLYGIQDVSLCPDTLVAQRPQYASLSARLPRPATWCCTPLSRTRRTAEAIFAAGYPVQDLVVVPGLIEQNLGELPGPAARGPARPARLARAPVLAAIRPASARPAAKAWKTWCTASATPWTTWPQRLPGRTWWS